MATKFIPKNGVVVSVVERSPSQAQAGYADIINIDIYPHMAGKSSYAKELEDVSGKVVSRIREGRKYEATFYVHPDSEETLGRVRKELEGLVTYQPKYDTVLKKAKRYSEELSSLSPAQVGGCSGPLFMLASMMPGFAPLYPMGLMIYVMSAVADKSDSQGILTGKAKEDIEKDARLASVAGGAWELKKALKDPIVYEREPEKRLEQW